MALDDNSLRCDNVDQLQLIICDLSASRTALFKRRRGDVGAVHDFVIGQKAIIGALEYLSAVPDFTELQKAEIIQTVWRRYRIGPTLGTGQACQYLLRFLHDLFSSNHSLEWPDWEKFNWKKSYEHILATVIVQ
jgi:hypothetical protein